MNNNEFAIENRKLNEAFALLIDQALKYMTNHEHDKLLERRTWHARALENHYYSYRKDNF